MSGTFRVSAASRVVEKGLLSIMDTNCPLSNSEGLPGRCLSEKAQILRFKPVEPLSNVPISHISIRVNSVDFIFAVSTEFFFL